MTYEEWRDEAATAVTTLPLPTKSGIKSQCFILGADGAREFLINDDMEDAHDKADYYEEIKKLKKLLKVKNVKIQKLKEEICNGTNTCSN